MSKETLPITHSHLGKFETISGKIMDLQNPDPKHIDIEDIATALSHIVRFGGHMRRPYTVGHHSILMSKLIPKEYALHALLHDATEAYLGDVIKPLKNILAPLYEPLEQKWEIAIATAFGIEWTPEARECVKILDIELLQTEYKYYRHGVNSPVVHRIGVIYTEAIQGDDHRNTAACFTYLFNQLKVS